MNKIKWGVLGTASIAKGSVIPAMQIAADTELYAVAGRSYEKAKAFQQEFGFEKAYGSYDELLDDEMVEAVYIPLPNHLHREWALKAVQKGKHVLCEKPMSGSKREVQDMIDAADKAGVFLMEAYAYLHSPYIHAIKKELQQGTIGKVKFIESVFYTQGYQEDIRIHKEFYGGGLYDLGCYNTSLILYLLEKSPIFVEAGALFHPNGVDDLCQVSMEFEDGVKAANCSGMCTGGPCGSRFYVYGTEGMIEAPIVFNQSGRLQYHVYKDNTLVRTEQMEVPNNYSLEVEQMNRCIRGLESPAVTHEFSLQVAEVDDWILEKINYKKPQIALTFDDGPNDSTTMEVLDRLEKYGVRASFFLIGEKITKETIPSVKRAISLGCDIQNHSFTHSFMDEMDAETIQEEIRITSEKITAITGKEPQFFRPPYIKVSDRMYDTIDMPFICGIGVEDWLPETTVSHRINGILEQAKDGALFLLHDMEGNENTVDALDTVIPQLLERGFEFVTVSEMFANKKVPIRKNPGKLYSEI